MVGSFPWGSRYDRAVAHWYHCGTQSASPHPEPFLVLPISACHTQAHRRTRASVSTCGAIRQATNRAHAHAPRKEYACVREERRERVREGKRLPRSGTWGGHVSGSVACRDGKCESEGKGEVLACGL